MKILFDCALPFNLAHGGHAIQIQRTMEALQKLGVEVEPLRWWDGDQKGDIIHYYCGRMSAEQIGFAHKKNMKVVMSEMLTGQGSRSAGRLRLQKYLSRAIERVAPRSFTMGFRWESYRLADAFIANTAWEKHLMEYLFGADPARTYVVPNGVEEIFFQPSSTPRGRWLVCTATITERKRVLELAEAAVQAQTPVWVLGRAYTEDDAYAKKFLALAEAHPDWVRFEGPVEDRMALAKIYHEARGFVLLSTKETRSLSAEEAAASGCPLLLSDLPWAKSTFGDAPGVRYCPITETTTPTAAVLKQFYAAAPQLPAAPRPATWEEAGQQFKAVYDRVLK